MTGHLGDGLRVCDEGEARALQLQLLDGDTALVRHKAEHGEDDEAREKGGAAGRAQRRGTVRSA